MRIQFVQDFIDKLRRKKQDAERYNIKVLLDYLDNLNPNDLKCCDNVYEYKYDKRTILLAQLFDKFASKFNISLIHKNIFDYSLLITPDNVHTQRILEFNYPVDSYPELYLFEKYNKKFDIVFDVGANIGMSACYFAKKAKQVYAFEPMPHLVEKFKKNIVINNFSNINIIEKAISNCCKKDQFCVYESDGHGSLLHHDQSKYLKSVDVDIITLDKLCFENDIKHIDMMSVDVEGYEYEVLEGAQNLLKNKAVDIILFEVVKGYLKQDKINKLFKYIESFDYEIFNLELEKVNSKNLNFHQDLLAMPKGKKNLLFS